MACAVRSTPGGRAGPHARGRCGEPRTHGPDRTHPGRDSRPGALQARGNARRSTGEGFEFRFRCPVGSSPCGVRIVATKARPLMGMSESELVATYLRALASQANELARLEPNDAAQWTEAAHALTTAAAGVSLGDHRAMVRGGPLQILAERIRVHRS